MKFTQAELQDLIDNVEIVTTPDVLNGIREDTSKRVGHDQPYYKLFYEIVKQFKPQFCVELGSWMATAASHLAIGNPAGKVVTVDIHREDKEAQKYVMSLGSKVPNLQYVNKWTWDAVDDITAVGLPIDILYIDAWHEYQYARREWDLYKPLLADTALVICDDLFDSKDTTVDMMKFWNELNKSQGMVWKIFNTGLHSWIPMGFAQFRRRYVVNG